MWWLNMILLFLLWMVVRWTCATNRITWGVCRSQAGISQAKMCFIYIFTDKLGSSLTTFRLQTHQQTQNLKLQNEGFKQEAIFSRQQSVACAPSYLCYLFLHIFSNFLFLHGYKQDLVSDRNLAIGHNHHIWLDNLLRQWIAQIHHRLQRKKRF